MAYLIIGEDIYKYREPLFCDILESLDSYTMSKTTDRMVTINFDDDEHKGFCIAMIKNDQKTKDLYFWGIIQASKLDRHLNK